ncbi:hypothetical protein MXB_527 [Myxobolus squamalis]|nr:hypothetical protein MXB_527 [Myxobolus squamalis]
MGSENPCWPLSRELRNLIACSHANTCPGRHPYFSHFRVVCEFNPLKTLPISFY